MKKFFKKVWKNDIFKICLTSLLITITTTFLFFYFKIWPWSSFQYNEWGIQIAFFRLMIYIILVAVDILFIGKIIFDLLFCIWELIENKKQNKNNKNNTKTR